MTSALRARARRALSHPRAPRLALAAALCLSLTTLGLGKLVDDRWHDVMLGDDPAWAAVHVAKWDLFRFFDGDPARTGALRELGLVPWWADPHAVLAFLRPLSSLTHASDRWLGGAPWVAHAQSIAWYAALVAAAIGAYRALLGPGAALGLAAWMYAIDSTHGPTVGWLANRNALVSATFGLLAIAAHARTRERRGGPWLVGALVALALAGGESGLATLAYLLAHALLLDDRAWRARLAALAPPLAVALAWLVAYRALGYGARHGGLYLDPLGTPWLAAAHVPRGALLLVSGCLGWIGPDPYFLLPDAARAPFVLGALAVVALALHALAPTLRADRRARFLLAGGALSVLPATLMVMGSVRMLLLPSFGLLGVTALALARWLDAPETRARAAWLAWSVAAHLAVSAPLFVAGTRAIAAIDARLVRLADATALAPGVERLVFVNAPEPAFVAHASLVATGRPAPARLLALGSGRRAMTVRRDDARTLTVTQEGSFVGGPLDAMLRARPMLAGARVPLGGVSVEVVEVDARGMPAVARFSFAVPLDDARLGFVAWDGARVARFALPPVGATTRVPAAPLMP